MQERLRALDQLFIEPCGLNTEEMYMQGMSSSLPEEVQLKFYHTIKGLEHCVIMRPAYAIEYDCVDPLAMNPTLEYKEFDGLFGAGQFNGSSGYEEAAAQGLVAGINAALKVLGREQVVFTRANSYIGTLVDDLVTKGANEHEIGLISDERYERFLEKQEQKRQEIKRLKSTVISPTDEVNRILVSRETSEITMGVRLIELLKRPQLDYECLAPVDTGRPKLNPNIFEQVEIEIKYEGYIQKQLKQVEQMKKLEKKHLPNDFDYKNIKGLRLEAQEKLNKIKPLNIGQASRISGVSPADISVLLIWLSGINRSSNGN